MHPVNLGKGQAVRTGPGARVRRRVHARAAPRWRHAASAAKRPRRWWTGHFAETRMSSSASGGSTRTKMPASRYHANRIGSRALSWFVGVPVEDTQCGFRVFRVDALRGAASERHQATKSRPKCWSKSAAAAVVSERSRSRPSTRDSGASCGRCATRRAPVFWRCTIGSLNVSEPAQLPASDALVARRDGVPRRWTLHGLNNGTIFGATYHGVGALPRRRVVRHRTRRHVDRLAPDARDSRRDCRQPAAAVPGRVARARSSAARGRRWTPTPAT